MTPDAPDVAEMVAWCERKAQWMRNVHLESRNPEYGESRTRAKARAATSVEYADDAAMLRAIAERLRRGGDHDAG